MNVEDATLTVVRALERMGVRHYVTGSLASSLHGDPRSTNDADVVAELSSGDGARLAQELGSRFFVDPDEVDAAVRLGRSFNLIDEIELAKVDIFCVRAQGRQAEALSRAQRMELIPDDPFTGVRVSTAEDTLLAKLRWYRQGGEVSDRQWRDLVGIVQARGDRLDRAYLERWCAEEGTQDLLGRLMGGTGAR